MTTSPPDAVDVAIVGGGLPGLVCALELAQAGTRVAVLEASHLGAGASGSHPGLVFGGIVEHPWRLAKALGDAEAHALTRFSLHGLDRLARLADVRRHGVMWAAVEADREPGELERSAAVLRGWDLDVVEATAEQVNAALGASHLGPGLLRPDEGTLDPRAAVRAVARAARQAGASLHEHTPVLSVDDEGDDLLVRLADGAVRATVVVFAAEHGARALHGFFADTLSPVREAAIRLEAPEHDGPALRAGFGWTTACRGPDGLTLAGCRWATPHLEEGETDPSAPAPAVLERLEATARRFFPEAGAVVEQRAWITAHGCDGLPVVGPLPGDPRRVALAGFAGLESTLGVASAHAVAHGLLEGHDLAPACLRPSRHL